MATGLDRYDTLGRTGLKVCRPALGTMSPATRAGAKTKSRKRACSVPSKPRITRATTIAAMA